MWRIVKQSDRKGMIDELEILKTKPLEDPMDQEQRARAIEFVLTELQASVQTNSSINLSGDWVDTNNNYLSMIIGPRARVPDWSIVKSAERERLISYLSDLSAGDGQQARAIAFALNELSDTDERLGSVNISGAADFLSLSVSAAN
jgi:hypothetical protein